MCWTPKFHHLSIKISRGFFCPISKLGCTSHQIGIMLIVGTSFKPGPPFNSFLVPSFRTECHHWANVPWTQNMHYSQTSTCTDSWCPVPKQGKCPTDPKLALLLFFDPCQFWDSTQIGTCPKLALVPILGAQIWKLGQSPTDPKFSLLYH